MTSLEIGDHLSLTDLVLPEGVVITSLQHEDIEAHDQTVCSVSEPKIVEEEEVIEGEEGSEDGGEDQADESEGSNNDGDDTE